MILSTTKSKSGHYVHLISGTEVSGLQDLSAEEKEFLSKRVKDKVELIPFLRDGVLKIFAILPDAKDSDESAEKTRMLGFQVCQMCNDLKVDAIEVRCSAGGSDSIKPFSEGLILTNYQFNKYRTKNRKFRKNSLKRVHVDKQQVSQAAVREINAVIEAVFFTRDLVNEPLSYLTATQYSKDIEKAGEKYGFRVKVLHQKKIEQMKMGGVLAVNKGSVLPATFNILEYKPANPANEKPIVLVGKGVMYDTGGLSLKPTANSMDQMKSDMGGSAVVVGSMIALAANKLNLHVISLIPAVENRPGGNAIVPGDVITMYDGTSVEVMNTDAEGRLILADALAYAKSLDPMLVMDFATLTGATSRAIGPHGIALMGVCDQSFKDQLMECGHKTRERLVEFPLWDEFGDMLDSPIADLKNIGGAQSGAITAGKFLQHFTDYPWMHLDIAGVSFFRQAMNYRGNSGTGTGVRLTYEFLKSLSQA